MGLGAVAAGPDYFPLQPGNQWVYRSTGRAGTDVMTVEVAGADTFGGNGYYLVRGLPGGDAWLRLADDGTLYAYDPAAKHDTVWAAFGSAEGSDYATAIDPCSATARVQSRAAKLSFPLGDFSNALQVVYPPGKCADAGITEDYYLPWVGLVQRTYSTIAGPKTWNLIYARLGDITVLSEKSASFSLSIDRSVYTADLMPPVDPARAVPVMTARLTIRNTQDPPLKLEFPSGQTYDVELLNEKGDVVYQWSRGKAFTMIYRTEPLAYGERNWAVAVPLGTPDGKPFPEGKYTVQAWLTTAGTRQFSATAGFELQIVQ